jgi:Neuraminidase (sialidase)
MSKLIAGAALLLITTGAASAGEHHKNWAAWEPGRPQEPTHVMAPEIDPASTVAAMTLLVGGLVVLRGRKLRI